MYMKYLYTQITRPIPQLASRRRDGREGKGREGEGSGDVSSRFVPNPSGGSCEGDETPSCGMKRFREREVRGLIIRMVWGEDTFRSRASFCRRTLARKLLCGRWLPNDRRMATAAFLIAIPKRHAASRQLSHLSLAAPRPRALPCVRPFSSRAPSHHTSSDN